MGAVEMERMGVSEPQVTRAGARGVRKLCSSVRVSPPCPGEDNLQQLVCPSSTRDSPPYLGPSGSVSVGSVS